MSYPKPGQQPREREFMVTELNSVLSVRAEHIRQRLLNERLAQGNNQAVANEDNEVVDIDHFERPVQATVIVTPISQARLRRRQKAKSIAKVASQSAPQVPETKLLSGVQAKSGKGGSTVDIKSYRPGYTWNRGGRVKELRIRCLARKYLLLWRRKTFGRIPLSVARQYYNQTLLHKCFYSWHDCWWVTVKEWRLGVRAEYHYRFKVALRMFITWKKFVIQRRQSKFKSARAVKLYNSFLVKKMWIEWKKYVHYRHSKAIVKKKADNFRHESIVRSMWTKWMQKHHMVQQQQENHSLALQFWAYRIQAQHWLIWKSAFEKIRHQRERYSDAGVYYNSILASRCLKAWKRYILDRNAKKAHIGFVHQVYCTSLKQRVFSHWCQRWHLISSLRQHQIKIDSLSITFRSRWIIWRWKNYIAMCKELRHKIAAADHHCNYQLQKLGFDAFRLNVVHSHIKVMRLQLADQLREKQLQRWAWDSWTLLMEKKEEIKLEPKTECAREHYKTKLLSQCFSALVDYVHWRRLRKEQFAKADAHFYLHIMPKCLFHMRLFVEQEKTCRENAAKALEFRKLNTLHRVFYFWHKASQQCKDERMMNRMALLHRESVILQSIFALWKERTGEALAINDKMYQARDFHLQCLCNKVLQAWKNVVLRKKRSALNLVRAVRHHYLKTLKVSITLWKKWVEKNKAKKIQMKKAETHRKQKILQKCVAEWKNVTAQRRHFKSLADVKYGEHSHKLVRLVFTSWHLTTKSLKSKRRKQVAANVHYNRTITHRILQSWHQYAVVHAYNRTQTNMLVGNAVRHLQQVKLVLYFNCWRQKQKAALTVNEKLKKADRHYQVLVERKVMETWKRFIALCHRKKLLARQWQWFHDVRLSAKYFLIWKVRLIEHTEEGKKSQLALWHWSLTLQQKVLNEWRAYLAVRKHKKSRMQMAMDSYRQWLLKEACCQWLATADYLSQTRTKMAARHQSKAVIDQFQLLHRCALHWKTWAQKRAFTKDRLAKQNITLTLASAVRPDRTTKFPIVSETASSQIKTVGHLKGTVGIQPVLSGTSPIQPFRKGKSQDYNSVPGPGNRNRPPPRRPAFLVDSLKRAGLYSTVDDLMYEHESSVEGNPPKQMTSSEKKCESPVMSESVAEQDGDEGKHSLSSRSDKNLKVLGGLTMSHAPHMFTTSSQVFTPIERSTYYAPLKPHAQESVSDVGMKVLIEDGANQPERELEEHSRNVGMTAQRKKMIELDACSKHDNNEVVSYTRIHEKNHLQQGKDTINMLDEEPVVLLTPEDFMKGYTATDSNMMYVPSAQNSSAVTRAERNTTKHSLWKSSNGSGYQIVQDAAVLSQSHVHEDIQTSLKNNSSIPELNGTGHYDTDHHKNVGYFDTVVSCDVSREQRPMSLFDSEDLTHEEELIRIRDRLKIVTNQKQKLRTLRKQIRQLSDWLSNPDALQDPDAESVQCELQTMRAEMVALQAQVDNQRPVCERLVKRAQLLAQELQIHSTYSFPAQTID